MVASSEHLAIEHVSNALKFRDLLSLSSILLISLDVLFTLKFIQQILVLVSVILGHFKQVDMDFLICRLFPAHESDSQPAFMLIDQSQLKSMKYLFVENHGIFPKQQSFVKMIAMTKVTLSQNVAFGLASRIFDQALFPVLELLLLRNFII